MDHSDVYRKLDDLAKNNLTILEKISEVRVGQAKMEIQVKQNTFDLTKNTIDMGTHIKRTDKLEAYVDKLMGFFLAISILSPLAAGLLTFLTNYFLGKI